MRVFYKPMKPFWFFKKPAPVEPDTLCEICGHAAMHHDAVVNNKHGSYVIEGCCVIEITRGLHAPWTMEALEAGQHKPCRCKWDGKTPQAARK